MESFDKTIIHKYFSNLSSEEETKQLMEWIEASEQHRMYVEELHWIWKNSQSLADKEVSEFNPDLDKALEAFKRSPSDYTDSLTITIFRRLSWVGVAAAVLVLIFQVPSLFNFNEASIYTTQLGETKELLLPDNTRIWLAENSKLTYKEEKNKRNTTLEGKAYFEVAKDANRPFRIQGNQSGITVLGTKFNYESNPRDNEERVYVTEGKVNYYALNKPEEKLTLTKGELGSYSINDQKLEESNFNNKNIASWATGKLHFHNTPMSKVVVELEKFYELTITIENKELRKCSLTADFDNEKIETVMQTLRLIYQCNPVKQDNGNYLLKDGSCL